MKDISKNGIELITRFEGLVLKPYFCSAKVPTIGYGSTFYEDGSKVKMTDKSISKERAMELFKYTLKSFIKTINDSVKVELTQNQFDSLVSICYNIGSGAFKKSTLLKVINKDPKDFVNIEKNFMKWNKAGGNVIPGLVNRRNKEYINYCK